MIAGSFGRYFDTLAAHFPFGDRKRSRSFAGLVLTAIEGAYIRGRADRSGRPFREAGEWLARLCAGD